jgi:hypothetical protein
MRFLQILRQLFIPGATSEPIRHFRFGILGGPGSGKTCILAALAMAREQRRCDVMLVPPPRDADKSLVDGYRWIDECRMRISRGERPEATRIDRFSLLFEFSTSRDDKFLIRIDDYSGELMTSSGNTSKVAARLREILAEVDGLLVVAEHQRPGSPAGEHAQTQHSLAEAVRQLADEVQNSGREFSPPIAFLVNKWDRSGRLDAGGAAELDAQTVTADGLLREIPQLLSAFPPDLEPYLHRWGLEFQEEGASWVLPQKAREAREASEFKAVLQFLGQKPTPPHRQLLTQVARMTTGNCRPFPVSALGPCHEDSERPRQINPLQSFGLEEPFIWLIDRAIASRLSSLEHGLGEGKNAASSASPMYAQDTPLQQWMRRVGLLFNVLGLQRQRSAFHALKRLLPAAALERKEASRAQTLLKKASWRQTGAYIAALGLPFAVTDYQADKTAYQNAVSILESPTSSLEDRTEAQQFLRAYTEGAWYENGAFRLLGEGRQTANERLRALESNQAELFAQQIAGSPNLERAVQLLEAALKSWGTAFPADQQTPLREFVRLWRTPAWKSAVASLQQLTGPLGEHLKSLAKTTFEESIVAQMQQLPLTQLSAAQQALAQLAETDAAVLDAQADKAKFADAKGRLTKGMGGLQVYSALVNKVHKQQLPSPNELERDLAYILSPESIRLLPKAKADAIKLLMDWTETLSQPNRVRFEFKSLDMPKAVRTKVANFAERNLELSIEGRAGTQDIEAHRIDKSPLELGQIMLMQPLMLSIRLDEDDTAWKDAIGKCVERISLLGLKNGQLPLDFQDDAGNSKLTLNVLLLHQGNWVPMPELTLPE